MVVRADDDDGTLLTEAIDGNGSALPVEAGSDGPLEAPDAWEAWMKQHKDAFAVELAEEFGWALGEARRKDRQHSERQIRELEQRVAKLEGAVDVLRGKAAPGSFVLRQEMLDSVGDTLGMVRADFEDKLAVQAKRISELELKLAEAVGALNALRGKGVPGSFNVKGTFDANAVYNYLDVVAFNGSSWVATRDRPGEVPGPGWQLLSSAGKRGPRGDRGPVGRDGADAPTWRSVSFDPKKNAFLVRLSDGSPGPLISLDCIFAGIDVDPATYSIRLVTIDGSELKFSLRGLFEQFFYELQ
jgi:hypothetical protein